MKRPSAKEYRKFWAEKLSSGVSSSWAVPSQGLEPGVQPELFQVVQSLREAPGELGCKILGKAFWNDWVYIKDTTLHVHTPYYTWPDELNLVQLATHLRLVKEVRLHTFHLSHYRTATQTYVFITTSPWAIVKGVLPFLDLGWNEGGKRAIKVTFDDFLRPVIEAREAKKPYGRLIKSLPAEEVKRISTYYKFPQVYLGGNLFVHGYSTESDHEVDVEGSEEDEEYVLY